MKAIHFGWILILLLISTAALTHGGRTDRYGGHNNRSTGGYHYHNAGSTHAASNPYQNHRTCGICTPRESEKKAQLPPVSERAASTSTMVSDFTTSDIQNMIVVLQATLKSQGYAITVVNGVYNTETKAAVVKYLAENPQR